MKFAASETMRARLLRQSHTAWVACSVDNHLAKVDADKGECLERVGVF